MFRGLLAGLLRSTCWPPPFFFFFFFFSPLSPLPAPFPFPSSSLPLLVQGPRDPYSPGNLTLEQFLGLSFGFFSSLGGLTSGLFRFMSAFFQP